jgi:Dimethyladenosine transferase (rRNA methylation)
MQSPQSQHNHAAPDARLRPWLAEFPPDLFDDRLHRSINWVCAFVAALSLDVLQRLGAPDLLAKPVTSAGLNRSLGLVTGFELKLAWLLDRAVFAGVLLTAHCSDANAYELADAWPGVAIDQLAAEGRAIDERNEPTIALLTAAAAAWPRVARGETSGEDALLNPEAVGLWLDYFSNRNLLYAANNRLAAIVAAGTLANRDRFSVLELGAGAGSGTEALLEELDRRGLIERLERYVVSEPSAFFRRRGERKLKPRFRDRPLLFESIDIDRPWSEQGLAADRFDLIYGVNVLHVAKDLAFSLREARARMAPGGAMVLGECLRPFSDYGVYVEFVFLLLDSFALVSTDPERRPRPGFLTPEEWLRSLSDAGFTEVELRPDHRVTRDIFRDLFIAAVCGR